MNVPFFDYSRVYASEADRYDATLRDVLGRSDFILRGDLEAFEIELARYTGARHAIGVANGTDAIWISLLAAGVKPGDEVIMPSHTYVATAGAAKTIGAVPVLVDCGEDHLVEADAIERAVTPRTGAIVPVQLNGRTAVMEPILEIAEHHGVPVIEDSAQGLGSTYRGRMAGTFGLAGTYSFFPAKVLGCFGDGGAIVTSDDGVATQIRMMRDHGRDTVGIVQMWGFNSRLDNIQAAILLEKFKTFDRDIARRRSIAAQYDAALSDIEELTLPPPPDDTGEHFDTFQNYEMEADRRDDLRQYLRDQGVGTLIQWGGTAVHQITALGLAQDGLARTEQLFRRAIMLPMNQYLRDEEVAYVIDHVRAFYRA